jgi:hypothetical protein
LLKQSNLPLGELSFGVAEETAFNVWISYQQACQLLPNIDDLWLLTLEILICKLEFDAVISEVRLGDVWQTDRTKTQLASK